MRALFNLCLVCVLFFPALAQAQEKPQLWIYCPTNLAVDENIDKLATLWKRAAAAGYTHVMLADSKFAKLGDLGDMTQHYFQNVERIKKIAAEDHLILIPSLFDIGYSNNLLWHDPNMAEGLPVKDQPFIVKNGQATPAGDPAVKFGKMGFKDDNVQMANGIATMTDPKVHARFEYHMALPQFRCYHVSFKIKTDHFTGEPQLTILSEGGPEPRTLQFQKTKHKPTEDWTQQDLIFNTLDSPAVNIYFGVWGNANGTLQWKDWKIEEIGLENVLRRPGAPCIVKTEDGKELTEGKDYEPIVDPKLGNTPWKGEYTAWHEPPVIHVLNPSMEGKKLRVSWYHPVIIYDEQVAACFEEPAVQAWLKDQAERVRKAFGSPGYMMQHDEIRVMGWDKSCQDTGETPGKMLADNVRYCQGLLKGSDVYAWSDMFDPNHNAVKGPYYFVKGPLTGSWEGLDPKTIIINWNGEKRDESLKFFADRGHRQIIAGFYDGDVDAGTKAWKASAAKVKGVAGYMYTTWNGDYSKIERFAELCGKN